MRWRKETGAFSFQGMCGQTAVAFKMLHRGAECASLLASPQSVSCSSFLLSAAVAATADGSWLTMVVVVQNELK